MKSFTICGLFFCLFIAQNVFAQDPVNVDHYHIQLKITDFATQNIEGTTAIKAKFLQASPSVKFQLLGLKAKGVTIAGKPVAFTQDTANIVIQTPDFKAGDTTTFRIDYAGKPIATSDFGGFYFQDSIAYNLGVSIDDVPHNFGKVWFPCQDNFLDKATYSYAVTTLANHTAVCNGLMIGNRTNNDGTKTWYWQLSQPISTYLASVAVGNYVLVETNVKLDNGFIPAQVWVKPSLKQNAEKSFRNLSTTLAHFENLFGTYQWPRVGYVVVPMTGGAMEHATSIAYPNMAVDGTLNWDRLWSHELSHSWFGNLVTCATVEDMWLNEAFARFCEAIHFENSVGQYKYKDYMLGIHEKVLNKTHTLDGGYYPVTPVPQSITYGSHVYDKGATIVYNLRNQMGDDLFFAGLRKWFVDYKFGNGSTAQLLKTLNESSGKDWTPFFNGWVQSAGFAAFKVTGFANATGSENKKNNIVTLEVAQRLNHKPNPVTGTTAEVWLLDERMNVDKKTITLPATNKLIQVPTLFKVAAVLFDPQNKLLDGAMRVTHTIDTVGLYSFQQARAALDITHLGSKTMMQIAQLYVMPDSMPVSKGKKMIYPQRYWTVNGVVTNGTKGKLAFHYDVKELFEGTHLHEKGDMRQYKAGLYKRHDKTWKFIADVPTTNVLKESEAVTNLETGEYAILLYME